MIGIYKITNPKGKIYIGQSINIKRRFKDYKNSLKKSQHKIYNSFKKFGYDNHTFEIIEKCLESELNDRERYYQDLYSSIGNKGLNCMLTKSFDRSGKHSEATILKFKEKRRYFSIKKVNPQRKHANPQRIECKIDRKQRKSNQSGGSYP